MSVLHLFSRCVVCDGINIVFIAEEGIRELGEGIAECLESMGKFGLERRGSDCRASHEF